MYNIHLLIWPMKFLKKKEKANKEKKTIFYIIHTNFLECVAAKFNICSSFKRLKIKFIVYLCFETKHLKHTRRDFHTKMQKAHAKNTFILGETIL